MNEEIMIDVHPTTGKQIVFCKSTLYKTGGRGPLSGRVMDPTIKANHEAALAEEAARNA